MLCVLIRSALDKNMVWVAYIIKEESADICLKLLKRPLTFAH